MCELTFLLYSCSTTDFPVNEFTFVHVAISVLSGNCPYFEKYACTSVLPAGFCTNMVKYRWVDRSMNPRDKMGMQKKKEKKTEPGGDSLAASNTGSIERTE